MKKPVHIFISYCHEDREFLKGLENHMIALKRDGSCDAWTDREIKSGDNLNGEINEALNAADIVLLLVSVDFLNSSYCMDKEFQSALKRKASTGSPRIIPIIVRTCDWEYIPELAELKAPLDGVPIEEFPNKDKAYVGIIKEIRKVIPDMKEGVMSGAVVSDHKKNVPLKKVYCLPADNDALQLLYEVLNYGRPENRKRTGAMYMQRIVGRHPDLISLSLTPETGPTSMSTSDHRLPTKSEFCEMADVLRDCGIFNPVVVDQEGPWMYYRYRISMDIDLEKLKEKVVQAMRERGFKTEEE